MKIPKYIEEKEGGFMKIPKYIEVKDISGKRKAFLAPQADRLKDCYPDIS